MPLVAEGRLLGEDEVERFGMEDLAGFAVDLLVDLENGGRAELGVWIVFAIALPLGQTLCKGLAGVGPVGGEVVDCVADVSWEGEEGRDGGALHAVLELRSLAGFDAVEVDVRDAADLAQGVAGIAQLVTETAVPVSVGAARDMLLQTRVGEVDGEVLEMMALLEDVCEATQQTTNR